MNDAIAKLEKLRIDLPAIERPPQPRHYAEEIVRLPTREERVAALAQVPAEHQRTVKFYVASHFARRGGKPLPEFEP